LRNRTVDLLLTIDNQHVPVTAIATLNWADTGSRERTQAATSARKLGFAPRSAPRMIFRIAAETGLQESTACPVSPPGTGTQDISRRSSLADQHRDGGPVHDLVRGLS